MAHGGEAGEIPVKGDDFAIVLNRDGPDDRIWHEVSQRVAVVANLAQDGEVARTRADEEMVRLGAGCGKEGKGVGAGSGHLEDASVGRQPEERCPHGHRDGEGVSTGQQPVEPWADDVVLWMVAAMGG